MTQFAIGGIQMHLGMHDNMPEMKKRLAIMMHLYPWVEMVVFSELCHSGPNPASAQPMGGQYETECQELAQKYGIWLIPGSYYEQGNQEGVLYNTAPVINPKGEIITRYRKMFPFTPYEDHTTPGSEVCVFEVPQVGKFGMSICYDIWFPELTRQMVAQGAEVIINPVMASFVDRHADLIIAQASAVMFQSYVFAINGLMAGGNGYSRVIDPAGQLLHDGCVNEEMIPIEVDFENLRRQRRQGVLNMGQPLKSFRDTAMRFPIYGEQGHQSDYLSSLGPLEKPARPQRG